MVKQKVLGREEFLAYMREKEEIFLVCGNSFFRQPLYEEIKDAVKRIVIFTDFHVNPEVDSIRKGIEVLRKENIRTILTVGGGSAMDVAKGIKGFYHREDLSEIPNVPVQGNGIELIAVPTTAGSGSESTQFSIAYEKGIKQNILDACLVPEVIALLPELLSTLPLEQRKTTLMDALCHSIESYWSRKATKESREDAAESIRLILSSYEGYLNNTKEGNEIMLLASNYAGRAIDISFTTAAHAMSYKITKLYDFPHGHSVAICLSAIWEYMLENEEDEQLQEQLQEVALVMGVKTKREALDLFNGLIEKLNLSSPKASKEEVEEMTQAVDPSRLGNNPMLLSEKDCRVLYERIGGLS